MEIGRHSSTRIYLALAALAILLGPVKFFIEQQVVFASQGQATAGPVLTGLLAGVALTGIAIARGRPMLDRAERLALVVLLLPQLADRLLHVAGLTGIPWLHPAGGGDALLLTLAAPLWLGLLTALQVVRGDVHRVAAGTAIAAVGAACLTLPLSAYSVAANQVLLLICQSGMIIATVWTWVFARERLNPAKSALFAGVFLLLQTAILQLPTLFVPRDEWQPIDWRHAAIPILIQSLSTAVAMFIWFWLLTRMAAAAFAFHPLAIWIASTAAGLVLFGVTNWREDAALAMALAGLCFGLRARRPNDESIALELT